MRLGVRLTLCPPRALAQTISGYWTQARLGSTHTAAVPTRGARTRRTRKSRGRRDSPPASADEEVSDRAAGLVAAAPTTGPQAMRRGTVGRSPPVGAAATAVPAHEPPVDSVDAVDPEAAAEARRKVAEDDVRLTMRMLMSRHFTQCQSNQLTQDAQLEEDRRRLRVKLEGRMRRLEVKNRNSARLLGAEAAAVGDGILPFFARPPSIRPSAAAGDGGEHGSTASGWRALNPVGLEGVGSEAGVASGEEASAGAMTELSTDDYSEVFCGGSAGAGIVRLAALTQPNLAAYDSEHDIRIRSDSVVGPKTRGSASAAGGVGTTAEAPGATDVADVLGSFDAFDQVDGNWTMAPHAAAEVDAQAALQRGGQRVTSLLRAELMADEEDSDFAVRLYDDDDTDLSAGLFLSVFAIVILRHRSLLLAMFYRPAVPLPTEALEKRNVEFTRSAWRVGLRPDQREQAQLRELTIEYPLLSRNTTQVRLGGTSATATVACELVEPSPYRPKHGFFEVHVRQLLTERDSVSKPRELKRIALYLERLLKGGVVETEGLCVLPGRRVWSVAVDILITNDEGNSFDVAQWAAIAGLQHFRRPELTIRGESVIVHAPHERDPVPLSLHHIPVCCSFAVTLDPAALEVDRRTALVRGGGAGEGQEKVREAVAAAESALRIVVDPSAEEAAAAASTVSVAVNAEGQVCAVLKGEGCDVRWALLQECLRTAGTLAPRILEVMAGAMAAHDERRRQAMKGQFLWAQSRTGVGKASEDVKPVSSDGAHDSEEAQGAKRARTEADTSS